MEKTAGPQASSVHVLKMRLAWKISTLKACGPAVFSVCSVFSLLSRKGLDF